MGGPLSPLNLDVGVALASPAGRGLQQGGPGGFFSPWSSPVSSASSKDP